MSILVNNKAINTFNFSGGECHVRINPEDISDTTYIDTLLSNSDSIMQLIMTVDAVRQVNADSDIHLNIPYFPYARQDRVCNAGEAFALKAMATLINQLHCASVTVTDPHSPVVAQCLANCRVVSMRDIIVNSELAGLIQRKHMTCVAPDKGSRQKVSDCAQQLGVPVGFANKIRDVETREIIDTQIESAITGDCIILDDICDGGRTFIELAKVLKQHGVQHIDLYVTHGIFSKGFDELRTYFQHIYCYHTVNAPCELPDFVNKI